MSRAIRAKSAGPLAAVLLLAFTAPVLKADSLAALPLSLAPHFVASSLGPVPPISRYLAHSKVAAVVRLTARGKADDSERTFEVVEPIKGLDIPAGKSFVLKTKNRYDEAGDLFVFLQKEAGDPVEECWLFGVTDTVLRYIRKAPSLEIPPRFRLPYFLNYLEDSDPRINKDAFAEFQAAEFHDIEAISTQLPRAKLRSWIADPEIGGERFSIYGSMLGLCGNADDAKRLAAIIFKPKEEPREGLDGIIVGYLLLTGETGLSLIEKHNFQDKELPFSESYAALVATRFIWEKGIGRISPDRLRGAIRLLLERPEFADLIIMQSARWSDWSIQKRLVEMYDDDAFNIPVVKRKIIQFMMLSVKEGTKEGSATVPQHAVDATESLQMMREKDPKLYEQVERLFAP